MLIVIEDSKGNDLCSFEAFEIRNFKNCSVADIDEDEEGIKFIRIQTEEIK